MDIRLETPTSPLQCRQWTEIMERVSSDVFGVEELAHVIETDRESAWLLALGPDPPVPGAGGASQRR